MILMHYGLVRCDLSPVEDNEVMHHCLACIQASSKLLQKCSGGLEGRDSSAQRAIQSVSAAFINNIIVILKAGIFCSLSIIQACTLMCVQFIGN